MGCNVLVYCNAAYLIDVVVTALCIRMRWMDAGRPRGRAVAWNQVSLAEKGRDGGGDERVLESSQL